MAQETALSAEESRLIWIDCEMTGLDINNDELCEVSVVPTDFNLRVLDEGIDLVIKPSQAAVDHMNDFVRNMHTSSGLVNEWNNGLSLADAQQQIIEYVQRFMPELMSNLHYRIIDVSTLKELSRRWYPAVYENKPAKHGGHRALADIIESIDELRYYRDMMFVQAQPSAQEAQAGAEHVEETSLLREYEKNGNALTSEDTPEKADY